MQIVIKIPDEEYNRMKNLKMFGNVTVWKNAICNGKPLPKGHGELKDINVIRQKLMIWDYKVNAIPNYAWKCIEDVPTIIGADKEG